MKKNIEIKKNDRREFIAAAATALFAGIAVQLLGCGTEANNFGNGLGSGPNGTGGAGDKTGFITSPSEENHPIPGQHIAIIKSSELANGQLLILSIQGDADHDHTISLTAADLSNINSGKPVSKTSSDTNDHYHTVEYS